MMRGALSRRMRSIRLQCYLRVYGLETSKAGITVLGAELRGPHGPPRARRGCSGQPTFCDDESYATSRIRLEGAHSRGRPDFRSLRLTTYRPCRACFNPPGWLPPLPRVPGPPPREPDWGIRYNRQGAVEALCTRDATSVHLESLGDTDWYLGLGAADRSLLQLYLGGAQRLGTLVDERAATPTARP